MDNLLRDLAYAIRTLRRAPGWTVMALVALALGTGANSAVFGFVDALLLRPAPAVSSPATLVSIFTSDFSSGPYGNTSYPDFISMATETSAFDGLAAEDLSLVAPVRLGDQIERLRISQVTGGYFPLLGLRPAAGRPIVDDDTRAGAFPVAMISHTLWERAFHSEPSTIGATIVVNAKPVTIVGIVPRQFRGLNLAPAIDVWMPLVPPALTAEERGDRGLSVVARLKNGTTRKDAQAQLDTLAARLAADYPQTNRGTLERPQDPRPMRVEAATRIPAGSRGDASRNAVLLMGSVGLVLLLACANVASLLLSRATMRDREFAVRRALGAGSPRLLRQLFTETAVLAFAATALGLLVAAWTRDVLPSFLPADQSAMLDAGGGWHTFAFALALAVLSTIAVGVMPALRSIRPPLIAALRSRGSDSDPAGSRARNALVSAQVGMACVLLIGAALLSQSVSNALRADLGFTTRDALLAPVELPATWSQATGSAFFDEAANRARAVAGVVAAGWARTLPLQRASRRGFRPEGYSARAGEDRELPYNIASAGYFEAAGIPLRAGRAFAATDGPDRPPVVIVNETLARRYFGGAAVGRHLTDSRNNVSEIVGVVGDTKYTTVGSEVPPMVYYPLSQAYTSRLTLVVRTAIAPARLSETVRRELRSVHGDVAVLAPRTLAAHVEQALGVERLAASLVSACGILALVLAVIGLYGAIAYLVAQRTREIGVRIALGATPSRVLRLVIGQGLWIAGSGIVVGLAAAAIAGRALPAVLYGVTPVDLRTYAAVLVVLSVTAALAALFPARRALRIDPARALTQD